jgi:hypothetical protein
MHITWGQLQLFLIVNDDCGHIRNKFISALYYYTISALCDASIRVHCVYFFDTCRNNYTTSTFTTNCLATFTIDCI